MHMRSAAHTITLRPLRLAIALLALAAGIARAATPAGVPEEVAREVTARAQQRGVPADLLLAPIAEAAARGAPVELVSAKVLEGLAKNVPPDRVAAVARQLGDRLARAAEVVDGATRAGLRPPAHRAAACADLAAALDAGVAPEHGRALVEAARSGQRPEVDAVVGAAHTLGELARRGVPPADALGLGMALARQGGARPGAELPALYDAWRAEGGGDTAAFLGEARRRVETGKKLDGMVDVFGESADHLVASDPGDAEHGNRGKSNAADAAGDMGRHLGAEKGNIPANPGKGKGKGKNK